MKQKSKRTAPRRRNASPPPAERAPPRRSSSRSATPEDPDTGNRLLWTGMGAAATAAVGTVLVQSGLPPAAVATGLGVIGSSVVGLSKNPKARSFGAGSMSAATGQFALMVVADLQEAKRDKATPRVAVAQTKPTTKPSNAAELMPGEVDAAMERSRMRTALTAEHAPLYEAP